MRASYVYSSTENMYNRSQKEEFGLEGLESEVTTPTRYTTHIATYNTVDVQVLRWQGHRRDTSRKHTEGFA